MAKVHRQISRHPHGMDADLVFYLKNEACPECGESNYIEAANGVEDYVDDEEMCMTEFGPRWFPYKTFTCANCATNFRVYLGAVAIEVVEPTL